MEGFYNARDWFRLHAWRVPQEHREAFLRDTGEDNLIRLRYLSIFLIVFSGFLLLRPEVFTEATAASLISPVLINIIFCGITGIILFGSVLISSNIARTPVWLIRLPMLLLGVMMLIWGSYLASLQPFGLNPAVFFTISLFVVYSVFIMSFAEASGIMLNGLVALYWINFSDWSAVPITFGLAAALVFFHLLALLVSRVIFNGRLSTFLNWENISSMNSTLKWEIKKHQQTFEELEAIKNDLDRQVNEKTNYLRLTNQRLQEEIAERSYADKVRTVLYRISGFVNQNRGLTEIIRNIHEQLKQILDVTNFMVGAYDSEHFEIEPVYQENATESFVRYRLGRTLSSYVIRHKRSLLANKREIKAMVASGEVELVGVPADSWLGVPLLVDDQVVGILMVQSYKSNVIYDQSDLQLLEYVSEHVALAIGRHEVQNSLIKAKDQAEESDRLKSAFLNNISHEIRTPMNSILGFTEVMDDPDFTDLQRKQFVSQVIDSGNRLLSTLTNMMELAKLQARQMAFDIRDVNTSQVLMSLMDDIDPIIGLSRRKGLEVRLSCDTGTGELSFQTDPIRFQQLMHYLAENAIKFTPSGYIEFGCRKYDQRQLLFWVKDSGIGMNDSELMHIFDWFIKGRNSGDSLYQGTGLGLTIAKLIVEQMNGQIWAESEPDKGSCFYFTLPASVSGTINLVPDHRNLQDSYGDAPSVRAV